jgi:lipopolysaccharide/colanic/teichoic acid biosynthesis glycosyltransferase
VRENALVIGEGKDTRDLVDEINKNDRCGISIVSAIDPTSAHESGFSNKVVRLVETSHVSVIAIDLLHDSVSHILPQLYNLIFKGVRFIDMNRLYEDVFDRVPLTLVKYDWFLENISTAPKFMYDVLKRIMDMVVAFILGTASLVIYPCVALAIKLDDGGPIFIVQERVGKNEKPIRIVKFRSMSVAAQDAHGNSKSISVTRVGAFIRKTRIDELPQLWNVVKGDISLIGPRPELPQFVEIYKNEIPFYGIRHLIKPGLSGWAQLYHTTPPKFAASKEDTAMKLSYDLFYIKNRSIILDVDIALKTIREIVSRKGL